MFTYTFHKIFTNNILQIFTQQSVLHCFLFSAKRTKILTFCKEMHKNLARFWLFIKSCQKRSGSATLKNLSFTTDRVRLAHTALSLCELPTRGFLFMLFFYIFLYTVPFGRAYIKCFSTINLSDVDFSELPNRWHK